MVVRRRQRGGWVLLCLVMAMSTAGCQWPMAGFNAAHTGFNPVEDRVNVVNVTTLEEVWSAGTLGPDGAESVPPIIAGSMVYAASKNPFAVQAFDAVGARNCSGNPKTCAALWTGATFGGVQSMSAVNGTLYVGTGADRIETFDAAGIEGCSAAPVMCEPLWSASGVSARSIVVAAGFVYATDRSNDRTLYAFDAAGIDGCSGTPKTCTPVWRAEGGFPAVANGILYTASSEGVRAFDAKGEQGCSGTPKTCAPFWTAPNFTASSTAPTIAHGLVFMGSADGDEQSVYGDLVGFDAAGIQGCSGSPKTCVPIWRAPTGAVRSHPAVAMDRLYVGSSTELSAFDIDACSTTRPPCAPLWSAPYNVTTPLVVANGVVYAKLSNRFAAFDGAGNVNCSGVPRSCTPIVDRVMSGDSSTPVIANGTVYLVDETLRSFALPQS